MSAPDPSLGKNSGAGAECAAASGKVVEVRFEEDASEPEVIGFPAWKRIFDIAGVLMSAPVWLLAMMWVALWVKLVSPGPIFFRQERIGYRGRRFTILKFRSMKVDVGTQVHEKHVEQLIQTNSPMQKLDVAGDSRLILGGRILRALGLDELPQILNVLRGEMSLVGPRPCTPHEFAHYQEWQRGRVNAPPGLTGFWQVSGKNNTTFNDMIRMDLYYAKNMSPMLDLKIVLKTIPAIAVQMSESWKMWRQGNVRLREPIVG